MDRIFLALLVEEVAPSIEGRRVRSVVEGDAAQGVVLSMSPPGPRTLVVNLVPDAAGIFFGGAPWNTVAARPLLRKWITGAMLRKVQTSELDRTVSIDAERVLLSGRPIAFTMHLEIGSTRTDLFLVEHPEERVVEVVSSSRGRLFSGETFQARTPPPGAQPVAPDESSLVARLRTIDPTWETGLPDRSTLMSATGLTPRLTSDLLSMIRDGVALGEAFRSMRAALADPRPTLLLPTRESRSSRSCLFLPIPPFSPVDERRYLVRQRKCFNDAMEEGALVAEEARRAANLRRKLASTVKKREASVKSLRDKLAEQLSALPDPEQARRHGERLLAGHASARPSREGYVVLPDPFDEFAADVSVPIDPRFNLVTNAKRWFERSRKSERTQKAVDKRLHELAHEIEYLEGLLVAIEDAGTSDELESLRSDIATDGIVALKRVPRVADRAGGRQDKREMRRKFAPRRFQTGDGHLVLVGRSARENEELTFRIAKSSDLWLHAAGRAGSHVVLVRQRDDGDPEPAAVMEAAGLAAYYSKGRNDSYVEVLVTERKNVRKLPGAPPGTVRAGSFRSVRVRPARLESELPDVEV